jgi:phosphatidate cytidylyltransferase
LAAPANNSSNLKSRVITGLLLGGSFLAALLLLPTTYWAFLMYAVVALGGWEWAGLLKQDRSGRLAYALSVPLMALALGELPNHFLVFAPLLPFWLLLVPLWLRRLWPLPSGPWGWLLGWVILAPTGLAAIELHRASPNLLLGAILLAVVADSGAYFTGRLFGKRKLAPAVSPGKTWEGAFGAAAAVALFALAVSAGFPTCGLGCLGGLELTALVLFVASVLGDLFESHAKRQAGVKDSGDWLPGHGGVLDRADSLSAVLPLAYLFWMWMT